MWGKSRRGWGLGLRGRSHYYFGRAVHHEIPYCEILHFVPVFLFGMTTLLFLLPVENIYENNVISTRRGVGSFAPKELQVTNRIKPENESTLHYTTLPLRGSWRGLFTQKSYKQKKSASFPLWSLSWMKWGGDPNGLGPEFRGLSSPDGYRVREGFANCFVRFHLQGFRC